MVTFALIALVASAGCSKDTDCKGARVCEAGRCVNPPSPAAAPPVVVQPAPTAPPPTEQAPAMVPEDPYADPFNAPQNTQPDGTPPPVPAPGTQQYPRTIYEKGYICREFLDAAGAVRRECERDRRAAKEEKREARERRRERREAAREERREEREREGPSTRFVGNIAGHGGLLTAVTPSFLSASGVFGASGSAGILFRSGIGIVAVANVQLSPNAFGLSQFYSVGPAVRFGEKSHILVGIAPTIGVVPATTTTPPAVGLLGSVFAQTALVLLERLTLMVQPMLSVDRGGFIFTLTGGVGVQF
ncbi:MAG: hypothetical protein ACO1OB_07045 [Archangium sp.]